MFKINKKDNLGTPSAVLIPATAGVEYKIGLLLTPSGALCSGTTVPAYVCGEEKTGKAGEKILGYRVLKDMEFKTELSAAGTGLVVGDKVTIATDGLRVTATKTDGVAEITAISGTAAGDAVFVRF